MGVCTQRQVSVPKIWRFLLAISAILCITSAAQHLPGKNSPTGDGAKESDGFFHLRVRDEAECTAATPISLQRGGGGGVELALTDPTTGPQQTPHEAPAPDGHLNSPFLRFPTTRAGPLCLITSIKCWALWSRSVWMPNLENKSSPGSSELVLRKKIMAPQRYH